MNTLERYIAKLYLVNVVSLFVMLAGFVVTVDVVMNLERFSEAATEEMQRVGSDESGLRHALLTTLFIFHLWWPRLLQLFGYLCGIVLIAAMGFTCTQLVRNREFVAILAAGVSLQRLVKPFVIVAAGVITLQAIDQEVLVPRVAHLLTRNQKEAGQSTVSAFPVRLTPDGEGRVLSAASFEDATGALTRLTFWERDENSRVVRIVRAEAGEWDGNAWILQGGIATSYGDDGQVSAAPIQSIGTTLGPTEIKIRHLQDFAQNLSWVQLSRMIESGSLDERASDRIDRIRWGRVASLVSNFVALLAAIPFFLKRMPQPMMGPVIKSAPIALAGLTAAGLSGSIALPGLPVWVGVFVPTLILVPLAVSLYTSIKT